jgi:hypothetical protein
MGHHDGLVLATIACPSLGHSGQRTLESPLNSLRVAARDDISTGPRESNVGHGWRTYVFNAAVTTGAGPEIVEESFASTEQDRHNRQMYFID